ncbi:E3 binding domain-containing protein [Thermus caliditerrae]|nr:E3 binding domain-containing protein [Thermus caliditerrae]
MEEPRITPLARRLAEENGIDWRRLKGTGPDGTIVERDILAFLAKVMAGEVDLPPMPEEPPPVLPEEDLKRAQEALGREGVDLSELIPEAPKAPTLQVEEVPEEELDLEPALLEDLELDLEEEELLLAEEPPAPLPEEEALALAEDWEASPPEEAPSPALQEELEALLAEEAGLEEAAGEPSFLEEALLEEEDLLGALEEPLPAVPETPAASVATPPPMPAPTPAPAPGLTPTASPLPPVLRAFRRRLNPAPLEEAVETFHRLHGVPKTPLPFLVRAAERALADLELPFRPLLGQAEGEGVRGLRPQGGFLALFHPGLQEGLPEEGGLLCFFGEEELHTGRPSLFLSPEGVLAASGLEGPVAKKLLERVALYLENPVLLLA